jgi:D-alanyl-D-alanine carboxypeptidase
LADPAVIVLDEKTGEVVFEKNALSARKPASVIKLITATAAYTYLSPSDSYTTSLWSGVDSSSVVIQGNFDPWFAEENVLADKMKRTSLGRIEWNCLSTLKSSNDGTLNGTTIYYSNLYPQDVEHIESYFKKRNAAVTLKRISQTEAALKSSMQISTSTSPALKKIVAYMLTWSDNLLAERIARASAVSAGNSRDSVGVSRTFHAIFNDLGISHQDLVVKDGSGLSRENRVTAQQISQLLFVMAQNEKYLPLIDGLPIGGVTGTLSERFIETAPSAVGLVRAKTGTLNGTTNLAGYIESEDRNYIFVIIADKHSRSYTVTKRVRATVDRILGKIAKPLLPELPILIPSNESTTALTL